MKPSHKAEPWLFALPALLVYLFIVIIPVVWSLGYSLMDWHGIGEMTFAGLDNYVRMFNDTTFQTSAVNNLIFMAVGTVFQLTTGLIMAILLSSITRGSNILRVIYFIPCIISSMAICKIFEKLLSVFPQGVIAALMSALGLEQVCVSVRTQMGAAVCYPD